MRGGAYCIVSFHMRFLIIQLSNQMADPSHFPRQPLTYIHSVAYRIIFAINDSWGRAELRDLLRRDLSIKVITASSCAGISNPTIARIIVNRFSGNKIIFWWPLELNKSGQQNFFQRQEGGRQQTTRLHWSLLNRLYKSFMRGLPFPGNWEFRPPSPKRAYGIRVRFFYPSVIFS